MRLLVSASQGGYSRLVLARRCWLRFLGGFSRLVLARRCWLRFLGGFSWLWLARRCWLRLLGRLREADALLAERACGVCYCVCMRLCLAILVSSRYGRESLAALALAGCSGDLPLPWARVSGGV